MEKSALWLLLLTVALGVLVSAPALGASLSRNASPDMAATAPTPVPMTDETPLGDPPAIDAANTAAALSGRIMLTPDGSFSAASLAGTRPVAPILDRTNGDYSPGMYMARDWGSVSKSEFPMLVGGQDSFSWAELEPVEGSYDWRRLDDMIAANAATGKKSAFGITTYNGRIEGGIVAPTWLINGFP